MEPHILLAQLRSLLERTPDFSRYTPASREHGVWLGQTHALISRWDRMEAISVQTASNFLPLETIRQTNISQIFGSIDRAIADLELQVPASAQVSFGAGDVYDFFNALNKVIASAEKELFIVDPYLDQSVFDHYLASRDKAVTVRLLSKNNAEALVPASQKYIAQHGAVLQLRKCSAIHDRLVFVDDYVCWLIGQSVKDAAKAKPTYLVQAPPDVVPSKLQNYESIWASAVPL